MIFDVSLEDTICLKNSTASSTLLSQELGDNSTHSTRLPRAPCGKPSPDKLHRARCVRHELHLDRDDTCPWHVSHRPPSLLKEK